MIKWIVARYDRIIYQLAWKTLKRMSKSDAGFAYLFELNLRSEREKNGMSPRLQYATERFHESIEIHKRDEAAR